MNTDTDVLVVGAGPVGLLLATELARDGVDVTVIDAMRERTYFCKALGVTARTLEIFEDLGIAQAAIDNGVWMAGITVFDNGKLAHAMDLDLPGLPYGALSLPQFTTERLLEAALHSHGGRVTYGHTCSGLAQDAEGVVAQVEDADGHTREMRCRWLVGCDGAHSRIRPALGLEFAGGKYPQTFMLADVEVEWDLPRGRAYRFTHPGKADGTPVAIPIHGSTSRYRLSSVLTEDAAAALGRERASPDLDAVNAIMLPLLPAGTELRSLHWSSVYNVSHRIVSQYGAGRVFLAGDAAHIHPPVGGQGMNTGLQDAHNLAWKLVLVARGLAAPALLESYSAERRPVGLEVVEETSRALNDVLAQKSHLPGMRETQLLVSYRGSAIVAGDAPGDAQAPAPGDRAPDAGLLTQPFVAHASRLREFIGDGRHLLVGFTGRKGEALDTFLALHGALDQALPNSYRSLVVAPEGAALPPQEIVPVMTDGDGEFAAAFAARPGSAWVIRPDGYIGWSSAAPSTDALAQYLRGIAVGPLPTG